MGRLTPWGALALGLLLCPVPCLANGLVAQGGKLIPTCRVAEGAAALGFAVDQAAHLAADAPRIGVFMDAQVGVSGELEYYVIDQRWLAPLIARGARPILIPPTGSLTQLHVGRERFNGYFLVGSDLDLSPPAWGAPDSPLLGPGLESKSMTELAAVQIARHDRKPLMGVCNGMQAINVGYGGSLYYDLRTQTGRNHLGPKGSTRCHSVRLFEGTPMHAFVGGPTTEVNSIHHMGVRRVGPGLDVSAVAPDGVVEAVYDPTHPFLIGVQWHPEWMMDTPGSQNLFDGFIEAARNHETLPFPDPE